MALHLSETSASTLHRRAGVRVEPPLTIALVNNMPDAALLATERQFASLVRAAAGRRPVRLRVFSSSRVERAGEAARHVADQHAPLDELLASRFDAVIVTGNEPRQGRLDREPYWDDLRRTVDWAMTHTQVAVWSCLAAHAAVLHLDGIEREPLPKKLSGVFECRRVAEDACGAGPRVWMPHSRMNTLEEAKLARRDYRVVMRSDLAGVDTFVREGRSRFLFMQGHPEYDTDTLLREYRRDVGRYLRGEFEYYPDEPVDYFTPEANAILRAFRRRATAHRNPELFEVFPNVAVPFAITNRWQDWAVNFHRSWMTALTRARPAGRVA